MNLRQTHKNIQTFASSIHPLRPSMPEQNKIYDPVSYSLPERKIDQLHYRPSTKPVCPYLCLEF